MMPERRRRRSENQTVALALLLDSVRERAGIDALVLSDRQGLLVSASTRAGVDPEDIAAHLPRTYLPERTPRLCTRTFKLGDVRLFIGAVGKTGEELFGDLLHAMRGVQRILA